MKKAVSMFLTAALAVSCLAGCGSSAGNTSTGNASAGADSSASDDSAADGSVFKIGSIGPTTGDAAIYEMCIRDRFPISGMNTPNFQGTGVAFVLDRLHYLALPVIVMTVAALGSMTRYVRAAMIDALRMDYIRTARAKGLKEKVVIYSHAWRNALLPVITLIISWFMSCLLYTSRCV